MCAVADYWPRIARIPLYQDKDLGEAVLCWTADRQPVRVTKPEFFKSDEEREAAIRHYEAFYSASGALH